MEVKVIKKQENQFKKGGRQTRLRVAAYARVSTDTNEQLISYESQKKYYFEKINENPSWNFVEIYADEAISGTLAFKRENFMRMIQDGLNHKFDIVLTKSISRFARNTVDTLKYVRLLKEKRIAVIFEEENINTMEMSGELLLTILSSVAQQEIETMSSHVKMGLKMKAQRGELIGFNNCYGYHYDNEKKTLSIVPEEAEIVRLIFKLYIEGHGCKWISNYLERLEIKAIRGKKKWPESSVLGILKNEKYVGDVLTGKTYTIDPISHKRAQNFGEDDKFYVKDHHEPIISRKDFETVQEIIKEKRGARATGRKLGNIGGKFIFSSKMACGFCGSTYSKRSMYNSKSSVSIWSCVSKTKQKKNLCPESRLIKEEVLKGAFIDAQRLLCSQKDLNANLLLDSIKHNRKSGEYLEKLNGYKEKKEKLLDKQKKLLSLFLNEAISEESYLEQNENLKKKIENIDIEIEKYQIADEDEDKEENGINKISDILSTGKPLEYFDEEVFNALVDYVIIGGYEDEVKIPYMIRFICKKKFGGSKVKQVTQKFITENNDISKSSKYICLYDFFSKQNFYCFEKLDDESKVKVLYNEIRVRIEVEC